MRDVDPAFDPRTFGYKKFSSLVTSRADLFKTLHGGRSVRECGTYQTGKGRYSHVRPSVQQTPDALVNPPANPNQPRRQSERPALDRSTLIRSHEPSADEKATGQASLSLTVPARALARETFLEMSFSYETASNSSVPLMQFASCRSL